MKYKGYEATIQFDEQDRIFVGRVLGMRDKISFHGTSVAELEQAFRDAVDSYVSHCERKGRQPDRQYSGAIVLRTDPELHRRIDIAAKRAGLSMNRWLELTAERALSNPSVAPADWSVLVQTALPQWRGELAIDPSTLRRIELVATVVGSTSSVTMPEPPSSSPGTHLRKSYVAATSSMSTSQFALGGKH